VVLSPNSDLIPEEVLPRDASERSRSAMMGLKDGERVDERKDCGENGMAVTCLDKRRRLESLLSVATALSRGWYQEAVGWTIRR
jgi:hypothetical protein